MSEENISCATACADKEDKTDNIDLIFDYVVNNKYAEGMSKNEKANLRRLAKNYVARSGQLFYRHRSWDQTK